MGNCESENKSNYESTKMKICFTALLLLVILHTTKVKAQFLYPAADKFPYAECVKERDRWVKRKITLNPNLSLSDILKNDNSHPDCSYKTGNYISRQCKIAGQYKVEYCSCRSSKNSDQIMVYSDAKRTKRNFGLIPSLGLICSPKYTKNRLCISKKTGKCTKMATLCPKLKLDEADRGKYLKEIKSQCIENECDSEWKRPLMEQRKRLTKQHKQDANSTKLSKRRTTTS